ncbi:MAG: glycosyltransferase [Actinomycetota bacterium]
MRVVRILTRLNAGGPARQALALRQEMTTRDVDEVLVAGSVGPDEEDLADALGIEGIRRVRQLRRPVRPLDDIQALRAIKSIIREHRPHVVHTHMSKAGALGRTAAHAEGVPVTVHTFHGHVLEGYFPTPVGKAIGFVERRLARNTSILIAPGEETRRDLVRHGVASKKRINVVPPGIDIEPLLKIGEPGGPLRQQLGMPVDARVIGFAGRFVPVKRLNRLVEAAVDVIAAVPEAHFILAGGGPGRRQLELEARRPPLRGRMHLLGWLPDLSDFYAACDVMVLTSASEGTPISLIEAEAAARPVVATRVGGVPDVVDNGATGLMVREDSSSIALALVELLRDPGLAKGMGQRGRARASARFRAGRLADDLLELYRAAVGGASA